MSEALLSQRQQVNCLACGYAWAVPLFDGKNQPLATLAWPTSKEASQDLAHYRLNFLRCLHCGHIYNQAFEYQHVPYVKNPNLMYNASNLWQQHLENICEHIKSRLPENATIIEIGSGSGGFLKKLASYLPQAQLIGFDPNQEAAEQSERVTLQPALFDPEIHLQKYRPDLILSRHVLEHLINPLVFIQELALYSTQYALNPYLFFEVPCVDRVIQHGRLEDLYYEHNSHFTHQSFTAMLKSLECEIQFIEQAYNEEVIYGLLQLKTMPYVKVHLTETCAFKQLAQQAQAQVPQQIKDLHLANKKIALWGGTGKGAAFIHHFGLTPEEYPLIVVDSDIQKADTFVPGTAYPIHYRDILKDSPVDIIIVPAQWRAQDIAIEIAQEGISMQGLLIEHQGHLIDFNLTEHPYRL